MRFLFLSALVEFVIEVVMGLLRVMWWFILRIPYFAGRTVRLCRICWRIPFRVREKMIKVRR